VATVDFDAEWHWSIETSIDPGGGGATYMVLLTVAATSPLLGQFHIFTAPVPLVFAFNGEALFQAADALVEHLVNKRQEDFKVPPLQPNGESPTG
jgi:hypothetical protein